MCVHFSTKLIKCILKVDLSDRKEKNSQQNRENSVSMLIMTMSWSLVLYKSGLFHSETCFMLIFLEDIAAPRFSGTSSSNVTVMIYVKFPQRLKTMISEVGRFSGRVEGQKGCVTLLQMPLGEMLTCSLFHR